MNSYEAVFIFRKEDEEVSKGKTLVKEELTKIGVTIKKEEDLGLRELAYPVRDETKGRYTCLYIDSDPKRLVEVERPFKLSASILKFLFIRVDE